MANETLEIIDMDEKEVKEEVTMKDKIFGFVKKAGKYVAYTAAGVVLIGIGILLGSNKKDNGEETEIPETSDYTE